ncbi:unnamed protein product [Symbiodinium sp. CCMP2592]|nr:unnamed protein product [Symbiodinium sp. CCMP2592]
MENAGRPAAEISARAWNQEPIDIRHTDTAMQADGDASTWTLAEFFRMLRGDAVEPRLEAVERREAEELALGLLWRGADCLEHCDEDMTVAEHIATNPKAGSGEAVQLRGQLGEPCAARHTQRAGEAKPNEVRVLAAIDPGEHASFTLAEATGRYIAVLRCFYNEARKFTAWAKERLLAVVPQGVRVTWADRQWADDMSGAWTLSPPPHRADLVAPDPVKRRRKRVFRLRVQLAHRAWAATLGPKEHRVNLQEAGTEVD